MKKIELKTGILTVKPDSGLDSLIGYGSRANKKRGFLFVSKVLGKHIPSKPSVMKEVHKKLAGLLNKQLNDKASVVIGFAETATGIGHGVFEQLGRENSFYIHTTRYNLSRPKMLEFLEEHSHAASHFLYEVDQPLKDIIDAAENIILVDDEITTGKTLVNIIEQLKKRFPHIKNYYAVSVINWMPEFPDDISFIQLYNDRFQFESNGYESDTTAVSVPENNHFMDEFIPYNFGRFGVGKKEYNFSGTVNPETLRDKKVLVLGTGEFMHIPYCLGSYLEEKGVDVYVQSTTRSPVNVDNDIISKLAFKDNYHENIDNFVYNVADKSYDKIFICYETPVLPGNHDLKAQLEKYCAEVEEIFFK